MSPSPAILGFDPRRIDRDEPRTRRRFGINVQRVQQVIGESLDTPMQERPEIWEPETPAAPKTTPRKVRSKPRPAATESVSEDVVTAGEFNAMTERMNRTYNHIKEEFKQSKETLQTIMKESTDLSSQLNGQLGLINAASQGFNQQEQRVQTLWTSLDQLKEDVKAEISLQRSLIENGSVTDSTIKTIKDVAKKSLDRWSSKLPGLVDGHVMNAITTNNLVDREEVWTAVGMVRKELEDLKEEVNEDLDEVQKAFEELRDKMKGLKRKIASGQCTCSENKRRRLESE
jgi:Skp family chaperone for outer membrane proteins